MKTLSIRSGVTNLQLQLVPKPLSFKDGNKRKKKKINNARSEKKLKRFGVNSQSQYNNLAISQKMAGKRKSSETSKRAYILIVLLLVAIYYIIQQSTIHSGLKEQDSDNFAVTHNILINIAKQQNGNKSY